MVAIWVEFMGALLAAVPGAFGFISEYMAAVAADTLCERRGDACLTFRELRVLAEATIRDHSCGHLRSCERCRTLRNRLGNWSE